MVTQEMLADIRCPKCPQGSLELFESEMLAAHIVTGALRCAACLSDYEIRGGIPDLVPLDILSEEWDLWKNHLDGFDARRQWRNENPGRFSTRITHDSSAMQKAFASFADIAEGCVLDIGCGPGNFRHRLDDRSVQYWGIDPLPLPASQEFPFVRAVAEHLPFRDGMFTDIVVMAAMDHFHDVESFCMEAVRVLAPEGRLHIVQSVHDVRGPVTAIKGAAHWIKDRIESGETTATMKDTPKHMTEFNRSSLQSALDLCFHKLRDTKFSKRWYSPENVFLSMAARS